MGDRDNKKLKEKQKYNKIKSLNFFQKFEFFENPPENDLMALPDPMDFFGRRVSLHRWQKLTPRPLDLAQRPIMPTAPDPTASEKSRRVRLTRCYFLANPTAGLWPSA
jgi:hypothetical protein